MIGDRAHWVVAAGAAAGLTLSGCAAATSAQQPPVRVAPIVRTGPDGAQIIVLTRAETARIGVQTQPVRPAPVGQEITVPFSALLYDEQGTNSVFVRTTTGAYKRLRVTVDRISGATVLLRTGPAIGTPVVTVGAPELLGAQLGVGGE